MKTCECGCGEEVHPGKRFRQGHAVRLRKINPNKGKHKTHCKFGHEFNEENTTVYKGSQRCHACLRDKQIGYSRKIKEKLVAGYGGKCMWPGCDIDDIDVLTLDHVNNDGSKERKAHHKARRNIYGSWVGFGGDAIYRVAIKEGFPARYQILCANHQMKKKALHYAATRRNAAQ